MFVLGTSSVAELLGAKKERLIAAYSRGKIAKPEHVVGRHFLWSRSEIESAFRHLRSRGFSEVTWQYLQSKLDEVECQ